MRGMLELRAFEGGRLVLSRVAHNHQMATGKVLLAGLLKPSSGFLPLQYLAVGSGSPSWDAAPPPPRTDRTRLEAEQIRKYLIPDAVRFVDADGRVVNTPTSRLRIRVVFDLTEANFTWREFGAFGGNATAEPDSGYLYDWVTFPAFTKQRSWVIEAVLYLEL